MGAAPRILSIEMDGRGSVQIRRGVFVGVFKCSWWWRLVKAISAQVDYVHIHTRPLFYLWVRPYNVRPFGVASNTNARIIFEIMVLAVSNVEIQLLDDIFSL